MGNTESLICHSAFIYVYLFILWEAVLKKEDKGNKAFSRIISGREKQWCSNVHMQRLMRICPHSSFHSVKWTLPLLGTLLYFMEWLMHWTPVQISYFARCAASWTVLCSGFSLHSSQVLHLGCKLFPSLLLLHFSLVVCTVQQKPQPSVLRCIPYFTCLFMVLFLNGRVKA